MKTFLIALLLLLGICISVFFGAKIAGGGIRELRECAESMDPKNPGNTVDALYRIRNKHNTALLLTVQRTDLRSIEETLAALSGAASAGDTSALAIERERLLSQLEGIQATVLPHWLDIL